MKSAYRNLHYWLRLTLATVFAILFTAIATVIGLSYKQTNEYLHPVRTIASGDFLRAHGIQLLQNAILQEGDQFLGSVFAWKMM